MSEMVRRCGRWTARAGLMLFALAAVYVWTVATPEIGPAAAPAIEASASQAALADGKGAKLWTFGFVGDTQLGEGIVDRIFRQFREAEVEFVLHLGDIVDDADRDEQWQYVLDQAAEHKLRLVPVVGNHDRMLAYADRGEIRFRQYFPELPETFYRFSHRGVEFLMLNSERSLAPWTEQGRFLAWQLEHHPRISVVCLHRPVFTCGHRDIGNQYLRRVWLHGSIADSQAALVLSGHHHYYDRTRSLDGITYVTSGGASHKLYAAEEPDDRTALFRAGVNHFGLVDVFARRLDVRVIDVEGKEFDRFSLDVPRRSGEQEMQARPP
ncbi:MAG TPA: metallophosphoesterase [Pirellulales bacterium]|nr:metallophosphoesterase [Pirellulales bacterium]